MSDFHSFEALEASAGSGKTFALVCRYLGLVFSGVDPNRILALTFTNKAANEMKDRIIQTFLNCDEKYFKVIASNLNTTEQQIKKKREEIYDIFIRCDIKILTFDAFFSKILRIFATNFGLSSDFEIDEEGVKDIANKEFIKLISKDRELTDTVSTFIVETNSTLENFLNTLDEIANQIGYLDYQKNTPFPDDTNFENAKEQIVKFCDDINDQEVSIQAEKLKEEISKNIFSILEKGFIKYDVLNYKGSKFSKLIKKNEYLNLLYQNFKLHMKKYIEDFEVYKISKFGEILDLYIENKQNINKKLNKISFNDLSSIIFNLLKDKDMINMLYFRLDSKIEHILIDEFQDTSVMQYKILLPLIDEILAGAGQNGVGGLFYVGDIKQSIYRFRGAKKEIFGHLKDKYKQIKISKLDKNYRSAKAIVKFVNSVFRNISNYNYEDQKSYLKFKDLSNQKPIIKNFDFFVPEADDFGYIKSIIVDDLEDKNLVLESAVLEVENLLKNGVKAKNIAILCYKNSNIDALKELLLEADIDANGEGGKNLFETISVKAIIEYAKFCLTEEKIYALNVEHLTSKKPRLLKLNLQKSNSKNVLYLAKNLEIGLEDKNILLLLEVCDRYENLTEFVFNNDKILAINEENSGVNLLTIHKSKGLEFDHVIICDNFQSKKSKTQSFIKEYNVEKDSWDIKFKVKNREFIDENYLELKTRIDNFDKEEDTNKLYVAFTRAVKSLIIVKSSTSNSKFKNKKNEKNENFLLDIGEFEFGNIIADTILEKKEILPNHINLAKIKPQNIAKSNEKVLNLHSLNFGLALHFVLENCVSFEISNLQNSITKAKNIYSKFLSVEDFEDINQRLINLFKNQTFIEITQNSEILKEQPFKISNEFKQIDLLCIKDDVVNIIDYKSGLGFEDKNNEQILSYKNAISCFFPNKIVNAFIFYILEDEILIKEV
ncbi:RecB-like helicase [Campylobacter sp. FMV-PI01]|uniref:DNA 3'-5' helicase n=1 Tax=Campylobacter portucalensis TaxID=2608384 RepID=A0A6L5WJV3_9BACT|nr:RecB-like helicase [Campylobacter portucalensis]MSN96133.1 RecB-like helicase [Campylobacter portucalensis]